MLSHAAEFAVERDDMPARSDDHHGKDGKYSAILGDVKKKVQEKAASRCCGRRNKDA